MNTSVKISVVVPVYNESESVAPLHREIAAVMERLASSYEIIFVDDGSTDNTLSELKKLKPVRVISFSRNFGKSQALQAGFRKTRGKYIVTMDGDLQDDPVEIPRFLRAMEETGAELVCGWKQRRLDNFGRRLISKIANGVTRFFTGTKVHDMNCCFKLYRREVTEALNLSGDMHRFIPALAAAQGFHIEELPIHHRERKFGASKYPNFRRFSKSFFDFVTLLLMRRFWDRPMHFFGTFGAIFSLTGTIILIYLTYLKIFEGAAIGDRPILLLGVLLVVIGVQLFSSGFLGELLIRQRTQTLYTIREEIEQ